MKKLIIDLTDEESEALNELIYKANMISWTENLKKTVFIREVVLKRLKAVVDTNFAKRNDK